MLFMVFKSWYGISGVCLSYALFWRFWIKIVNKIVKRKFGSVIIYYLETAPTIFVFEQVMTYSDPPELQLRK